MRIRLLCGSLRYDEENLQLFDAASGRSCTLNNLQNRFLSFLLANANRRCTKEQIETAVWDDDTAHDGDIARIASELRRKLDELCGADERQKLFPNAVKNAGYILRTAGPEEAPAVTHEKYPEMYTLALLMEVNDRKADAFALHQQLAAQNYPHSVNFVGVAYMKGIGVERNAELGIRYYEQAAALGYPPAMLNLGDCCMDPMGSCYQPEKAVEWYLKAAESDPPDGDAMYRLFLCYQYGRGVAADPEKAEYWRKKAAEHGVTNYVDYYEFT